ncbi:MAG: NADH:flavin oxidoreductase, partial [Clostridiales bacterium]|nr:NADH:flavin oxidoreductase [Clostridiales bacterium]
MNKFPHLFSEMKIRNCTYKNRIIASPITANQIVNKGCITPEGIEAFENKARGGFAQVTLTESFVDFDYASRHDHGLDLISPGLSSYHLDTTHILTSAIHSHNCLAFIQFNHVGMVNHPDCIGGKNPIGPSHVITDDGVEIDEMDEAMMKQAALNFANAAANAQSLGFDGVNIHGGHGWLLSQFVSPLTNKRTDKYGGSMENRARFPIMVLDEIRKAVGENFVIEYRVSASEGVEGGLTIKDTIEFCKLIQDKIDLLHVTNGIYHKHVETKAFSSMFHPHGCNANEAAEIKAAVHVPVVVVGGINDPALAEEIIATGKADFVALGRQQFADPEFALKAMEGREDEI